jgi:hypothetical protein
MTKAYFEYATLQNRIYVKWIYLSQYIVLWIFTNTQLYNYYHSQYIEQFHYSLMFFYATFVLFLNLKRKLKSGCWRLTPVNLANLGGWDQEDCGSRPAWANSLQNPMSKITRARWMGGVA